MAATGLAAEAFLLGISSGPVCLASCSPVLLPVLAAERQPARGTGIVLGKFLAGRLAGYLVMLADKVNNGDNRYWWSKIATTANPRSISDGSPTSRPDRTRRPSPSCSFYASPKLKPNFLVNMLQLSPIRWVL